MISSAEHLNAIRSHLVSCRPSGPERSDDTHNHPLSRFPLPPTTPSVSTSIHIRTYLLFRLTFFARRVAMRFLVRSKLSGARLGLTPWICPCSRSHSSLRSSRQLSTGSVGEGPFAFTFVLDASCSTPRGVLGASQRGVAKPLAMVELRCFWTLF